MSTAAHGNVDAMSSLPFTESLQVTPLPPEIILLMEELNTTPITAKIIRVWTNSDLFCSYVRQFVQSCWPDSVQDITAQAICNQVQDGCILWGNRVVISKAGCGHMLRELHEAHPAETRMKRLVRIFFWWPGLDHDIEPKKVKGCHEYQNCRPKPSLAPLILWKWPSQPWSLLHIHFARPFNGQMFLVVTMHTPSGWRFTQCLPLRHKLPFCI